MANSLLSIQMLQSIIFIAFCVLTTPTLSIDSSSASNGMILDLIYRDTIYPTTYPPGSTLLDRVDLALSRVLRTRNGHHKYLINSNLSSDIEPSGALSPGGNTFYVKFFLGSKYVPQMASLDTGSLFLWVQCFGYSTGYPTVNPVYDPTSSDWYTPSTCFSEGDSYCKYVPSGSVTKCDGKNRCEYDVRYYDGTRSKGFIGFDNITFVSPDKRFVYSVPKVAFGCGMDNNNKNKLEDGVFGIGSIFSLSIIGQQGGKFSFCFGGIERLRFPSHLALGFFTHLIGVPVPLKARSVAYVVTLQGIVFAHNDRIRMSPVEIMVDTGSTVSYISNDIYTQIRSRADALIGNKMKKIQTRVMPNGLCYEGQNLISGFPMVTLEFGPHTGLYLDICGMFWKIQQENAHCLAFMPTNDHNVLGAIAMQYHNVGFDMNLKQAYFSRVHNCSRLTP